MPKDVENSATPNCPGSAGDGVPALNELPGRASISMPDRRAPFGADSASTVNGTGPQPAANDGDERGFRTSQSPFQVLVGREKDAEAEPRPNLRRRWSEGADLDLLSMAHQPLERMARRFGRSAASVLGRLRRLGQNADFFGGYKTKDLTGILRVDESKIRRWQRRRWLQRRRGRITEASLRSLCVSHPEEIPYQSLPQVTREWLVTECGYRVPASPQAGMHLLELEEPINLAQPLIERRKRLRSGSGPA